MSFLKSEILNEYWRYRELFYFFVWRDIKVRYKQSILGASWAVIKPFTTMIIFSFVFGRMAKIPSDGLPYPIFSYSALVPWTFFASTLAIAGNSLVMNSYIITKIYFPRAILPISSVFGGIIDFLLSSIVLLGMMIYYGIPIGFGALLWIVLLIPLFLLTIGAGMILSSLYVRFRDVGHALPFIIQIWLFVTPVIYPTSIVPEKYKFLTALNPMTGIIEAFRAALLPARDIDWHMFSISCIVIVILFFIGTIVFRKTEKVFADII